MNGDTAASAAFDDLVSVREAAGLLRVSESTVWRWINETYIPSYRVGRKRVYLKRAELAPLIRERKDNGTANTARGSLTFFPMSQPHRNVDPVAQSLGMIASWRAEHRDERWPAAWQDINEMREERSRDLE